MHPQPGIRERSLARLLDLETRAVGPSFCVPLAAGCRVDNNQRWANSYLGVM